jgi:starch synthase (maltosyl-transferring)
MSPAPGERQVRFVGDCLTFHLRTPDGGPPPPGWEARLRTTLGRGAVLCAEIVRAHATGAPAAGAAWRDLPMRPVADGWSLTLPLPETGCFRAKAYVRDRRGWQHWPAGPDFSVSVQPDFARTANTIYCAWPRLCGATRTLPGRPDADLAAAIRPLDELGYSVLPPSGKLRDLIPLLPHIVGDLGCRILHLLPIHPTPTTFARFGRYGSPYAALDLTAVDPALVDFDRRTTGVDQFRELAAATHRLGARLLLDLVINHTGWGSTLFERHPEWFVRQPNGAFQSPGAWGNTWEDLVELKHDTVAIWDEMAGSLLNWCRRGVDGFRCDAGYMVPLPAWQYIIARVRQEFPDTLFLLEGLGGAWEATAALLGEGGMQWAYSELFQNYSGAQVSGYLEHAWTQSGRAGLLVHYSETHDNPRLAAQFAEPAAARAWALLRNRLCALTSVSGGFGFTSGVEWLAREKINVHGRTGLNWDAPQNLKEELARLNGLLAAHPCFFDGAKLRRLSPSDSPVLAFRRESAEGLDAVLVLVNLDPLHPHTLELPAIAAAPGWNHDLLGQAVPAGEPTPAGALRFTLPAGGAYCLAATAEPRGLGGEAYRRARAQAAWALGVLHQLHPIEALESFDWRQVAAEVERSPADFLIRAHGAGGYPRLVRWSRADCRRVTPVPPEHWVLIEDEVAFRATLARPNGNLPAHWESFAAAGMQWVALPPQGAPGDATLMLERFTPEPDHPVAALCYLAAGSSAADHCSADLLPQPTDLVLLTNGRGGMARLRADLGRVESKYDCALGANLHPALPVDRHVFVKRLRAWVNADGFIAPLDRHNLRSLTAGPPANWRFAAHAGDGRTVEIQLAVDLLPDRNTTVFCFSRPARGEATGKPLPEDADVRITVRVDLEDRNFHQESRRSGGADHHFNTHTRASKRSPGFTFTPAVDRHLHVFANAGAFHAAPEWSVGIAHPIEASRGQTAAGDAWSPGWFELPLPAGASVEVVVCADPSDPTEAEMYAFNARVRPWGGIRADEPERGRAIEGTAGEPGFLAQLTRAAQAFVVRREEGRTVIAGYPWFLDWGRDTLICARGLLAAGQVETVREILLTFARYEDQGTLPNIIHGEHVGNRDTSDAPLWFGVVAEELALAGSSSVDGPLSSEFGVQLFTTPVPGTARTLADVVASIARHCLRGTPNGIRVDRDSGLVWSPGHFTWMDTNHPAGTPREGYPIEIQCLWIRLLRLLARLGVAAPHEPWAALAERAQAAIEERFWLEEQGWYADVLLAPAGTAARNAVPDDALRSNCLFAISLGLVSGARAQRCVEAARRWLVVPGALRTLAPLPVRVPLAIRRGDGALLNHPNWPYWGRYEGDEDARRKPAYHNGTAWTWTLPGFCEALARAWDFAPDAVAAARAYLGSMEPLLAAGCLGHLPEILDGDAPHTQRGCDAQAWGVTEALRVARLL